MERLTDRIAATMAAVLDSLGADETGLEVEWDAALVSTVTSYRLTSVGPLVIEGPAILFVLSVVDPISNERMTGTFTTELPVVTDDLVTEVTRNLWYRVSFNLHLSLLGFQDEYHEVLGQDS